MIVGDIMRVVLTHRGYYKLTVLVITVSLKSYCNSCYKVSKNLKKNVNNKNCFLIKLFYNDLKLFNKKKSII